MKVTCEHCFKGFSRKPSEIRKHVYCSHECFQGAMKKDKTLNGNYRGGRTVKCDSCGKEHYRIPANLKNIYGKFFCSKNCCDKWRSINLVGEKASNHSGAGNTITCKGCGVKFFTYHKKRKYCSNKCKFKSMRVKKVSLVCRNCGNDFTRKPSGFYWATKRGATKFFCCASCRAEHFVGKDSPVFISDRTKLKDKNKTERGSKKMKDWRKAVYERDHYTCQLCGSISKKGEAVVLNSHHIIKFSVSNEKKFDVNNGITLCEVCHKKTYGREEKYEGLFNSLLHNGDLLK